MNYDIVLFDLDGTLLNTLEDLADSVNYVMEQMGYPKHPLEDIRNYFDTRIMMETYAVKPAISNVDKYPEIIEELLR